MQAQYMPDISDQLVDSDRIIYTLSPFARSSLLHLQEIGTLQAKRAHKSERSGLQSCLFFMVLSGTGQLSYDGVVYDLKAGDCVFIDCKKPYSHETGMATDLWALQWCHFYGPNMGAIYRKYQQRGGRPVFQTGQSLRYRTILEELYGIAASADYVRDMRIHEKLSSLLVLLMEDAWDDVQEKLSAPGKSADVQQVKEYLDSNFKERITLDDLAAGFYINKYYLQELFKERYGSTVNAYLNQVRITYVKQQLRFADKTVEALADELHIEPAYLSRLFKKVEGVSPSQYRKSWRGRS